MTYRIPSEGAVFYPEPARLDPVTANRYLRDTRSFETNKELIMIQKLETGDTLPEIQLQLVGGGTLSLPGDIDSDYGVALFYRGYW